MLIDTLRSRRSIRAFKQQPVEEEKLNILIEAMLRSPSSKGNNPWEFIVVADPDRLQALAKAKTHGSTFLKNAPLAIVVCANTRKSDVWVEDASIASIILHLTAEELELGSCWVQIRLREYDQEQSSQQYLAKLLQLPEDTMVEAIIGIGYPKEKKTGHPQSSLLYERVNYELFDRKK